MSELPVATSDTQVQPRDRRASERYACGEETVGRLIASRTGEYWPATVRDVSSGGIGLVLPRRFEPGTLLAFEIHNNTENYTRTILAKVMRIHGEPGGNWLLGCALAGQLSEEDLEALRSERMVQHIPSPTHRETRAWVRNGRAADKSADQWPATVLSLTAARIGLLVPRAFKRGALLRVEMQPAPDQPTRSVLARVINSNAQFSGEWALTCSLARKRSEEEVGAAGS